MEIESIIVTSERIGNLIRLGDVRSASFELKKLVVNEKPWRRLYGHYHGKMKIVSGNFSEGCETLHKVLEEEGPHILIYADLVAGYYMDSKYTKWKMAIDDLENEFRKVSNRLHPTNRARAQIILAKSLELNGHILESYEIFKELSEVGDLSFRIKGLLHLVRLEAQYPMSKNFSQHYLKLKTYTQELEVPDSDFDVLHSLLLAESEHLSIELGMSTLQRIPREQVCFFTLGYFELLDIGLRKDSGMFQTLKNVFGHVEPFTESDRKFLQILNGEPISNWYCWPSEIPLAQYFRLLRFLLPLLSHKDRDLCLQQVHLFLTSLSPKSRKFWLNFFIQDGIPNILKQYVNLILRDNGVLEGESVSISFGRQKLVILLLRIILQKGGRIELHEVSEMIWNMNLNDYARDRIRQLVNRINLLAKKSIHQPLLIIKDKELVIGDSIRIQLQS